MSRLFQGIKRHIDVIANVQHALIYAHRDWTGEGFFVKIWEGRKIIHARTCTCTQTHVAMDRIERE